MTGAGDGDRIRDAIRRGLNWLIAAQEPDGSWPDFIVSPTTEGREWTTGYVAVHLADLPQCQRGAGRALVERARVYVEESRRSEGGWGFWPSSPVDADSTAWCVMSLAPSRFARGDGFEQERSVLLRHQLPSGGLATYHPADAPFLPSTSGYFEASPCVSAAAALALLRLGESRAAPAVAALERYLGATRRSDGSWPTYWWDSSVYSTAMATRALLALGHDRTSLAPAARWLEEAQLPVGAWPGVVNPAPNAFFTAIAISALLDLGRDGGSGAVARAVGWLLDGQRLEGTWPTPPIMKVPPPGEPWDGEGKGKGTVIVPSHRHVFVVATVLAALGRLPQGTPDAAPRLPDVHLRDPDLEPDVERVIETFDREVARLPRQLARIARIAPDWHLRGAGLSHYLPFWLDACWNGGAGRHGAARAMALANRDGQMFCLLRDGVIDADVSTTPHVLLPADALFLRFVRGYQALFAAEHRFWDYFERYWLDYLEALAREKRRRGDEAVSFDEEDFRALGHKFAPVKICAAGMALLTDREAAIDTLSATIDALQTGFQLLDDLRDLANDCAHGHLTWPLALLRERLGDALPAPDRVEPVAWRSGTARTVLERALEELERARTGSIRVELTELARWSETLIDVVRRAIELAPQPDAGALAPLRVLEAWERRVVLNVETGMLSEVDAEVAEVARKLADGERPEEAPQARIVQELAEAGLLARDSSPPPDAPRPSVIFLGAHPGAGHRCVSCPSWARDEQPAPAPVQLDSARAALDLLHEDGPRPAELVLLDVGGAVPWAAAGEILELAAKPMTGASHATVVHAVWMSGEPDREVLERLTATGGSVLVRRDGVGGWRDLDGLRRKVERLLEGGHARVAANVGLRNFSGSPARLVEEICDQGVQHLGVQSRRLVQGGVHMPRIDLAGMQADYSALVEVFAERAERGQVIVLHDVIHPLMQLYRRQRSSTPCGASTRALAVGTRGEVLTCFRLSEHPALAVGAAGEPVSADLLRPYRRRVDDREPCRSCWARYLCGGGCHAGNLEATGDIRRPRPDECRAIRDRYRQAAVLVARLAPMMEAIGRTYDESPRTLFQV